jgi:hypothetical protein
LARHSFCLFVEHFSSPPHRISTYIMQKTATKLCSVLN